MAGKKIRNPLVKRLPREFLGEWKKYLVVFIFLVAIISSVSGMYVANNSMLKAADDGIEEYKREDGNFELEKPASEELIAGIESGEKADLLNFFEKKGIEELDKEFDKEFKEEFDKGFDEEVEKSVRESVKDMDLTEEQIQKSVDDAIKEARASEDYKDAYDEAYEKAYEEASEEVKSEVKKEYDKAVDKYELDKEFQKVTGVKLYENFFADVSEDKDRKIRVFKLQNEINVPSIFEGQLPTDNSSIAIDRMHADNAGLKVGDTVNVNGKDLKITALIALPNYSTLYENNSDTMFDSIKFDVGVVTPELFDEITKGENLRYSYAWRYAQRPDSEETENTISESFLKVVMTQSIADDNELQDYLPAYLNQAITFATDDFSKDLGMVSVFMDIFMIVIAFIFGVTISSTIAKESKVIGTLRASGYTKGELIRHYLCVPVIVTVAASMVGNILGYTLFKDWVASMYYNSYSLPTFKVVWNLTALYKTTLIPFVIMFVVNLVVISYKLRFSPLEFLRNDLKKTKRKNAMRLPRWSFFKRFRLRIIFQNVSSYLVLALGVIFIMFLMAFAIGAPDTINKVKDGAGDMIICDYQTILKKTTDEDDNEITTSVKSEKFSIESLRIENENINEDVSVYGIEKGSSYINMPDMASDEVMITKTLSEKYNIKVGDVFKLNARFEKTDYEFKVGAIEDRFLTMAVFMPTEEFNERFDRKEDEFSGFFSDQMIDDIDSKYIAKVITIEDIMKTVDQLDHSMGNSMFYFQVVCVILAAVLTFLLTKVIIDKSENSISMVKILGYKNSEIASLYIIGTTIIFILIEFVGMVAGIGLITVAWGVILQSMSGWYEFYVSGISMVKMIVFVFIGYLAVMLLDFRRIKKVPLDEALKNVE